MGTGKSSLGRLLSNSLGLAAIDSDEAIVARAGKSISEIFAIDGEEHFRRLESEVLQGILEQRGQVIATGGGIVLDRENRRRLHERSFVVWLQASPDEIYERVRRTSHRPLLEGEDPEGTIRRMLEEREPLYRECAHLEVDTNTLTLEEAAHGIAESARLRFSGEG